MYIRVHGWLSVSESMIEFKLVTSFADDTELVPGACTDIYFFVWKMNYELYIRCPLL